MRNTLAPRGRITMDKRGVGVDSFQPRAAIPRFFLYGEPPRDAPTGFLHVESIAERSRLYDWKIRPHAHADLNQLLLVLAGRGEMRIESRLQSFAAPALLVVPAAAVHAFEFEPETVGYVITIAEVSLREVARREPALGALFNAGASIGLAEGDADPRELERAVRALRREIVWPAPAHDIAAEAQLTTLLVGALRAIMQHASASGLQRGPRAALVARFRDALDAHFRAGWSLGRYAEELGVSPTRLRAACMQVTGKPPTRLVHERVLLEAKRSLTYSNLTIAQIAYDLGFFDPGYFSRFFTQRAGESPAQFRARTACAGAARSHADA
jgi:AraC family transcriptional activator of pobA